MRNNKVAYMLSTIFFTSLGFGAFNIDAVFFIKPYMFAVLMILIYIAYKRKVKLDGFTLHEYLYFFFLVAICLSATYTLYTLSTLRYVLGVPLLFGVYIILRIFFTNFVDFESLKKSISVAGIIVGISSLAYYAIGVIACNFNFQGKEIELYGLLIDRDYPRLIGTVTNDPNLTAFYLSFFFFFFLIHKKYYVQKILYLILIALTISRGAYISIVLALLIFYLITNKRQINFGLIKMISIGIFLLLILGGISSKLIGVNISESISGRFEAASEDQGSGRIDLWRGAIQTFKDYPLFGIGANSSYSYNSMAYGLKNYSHNSFLDVLSEIGIIGMSIFISGIYFTIRFAKLAYEKSGGFALILYIGVLFQMIFLSLMINELYLVSILIVYLWGRNSILEHKLSHHETVKG